MHLSISISIGVLTIYHCALCLRVWWAFPSFIIRISKSGVPDWSRPSLMWNYKTTTTTCDTPRRLTTIVRAMHTRVSRVEQAFLTMRREWWLYRIDNIFDNILSENQTLPPFLRSLPPNFSIFTLYQTLYTGGGRASETTRKTHKTGSIQSFNLLHKAIGGSPLARMHPEVSLQKKKQSQRTFPREL